MNPPSITVEQFQAWCVGVLNKSGYTTDANLIQNAVSGDELYTLMGDFLTQAISDATVYLPYNTNFFLYRYGVMGLALCNLIYNAPTLNEAYTELDLGNIGYLASSSDSGTSAGYIIPKYATDGDYFESLLARCNPWGLQWLAFTRVSMEGVIPIV